MASVTVLFGGHEQATHTLDKPMIIVGREETCQIHIDNRSISRQHCAFVQKDGGVLIQDLNSANGTYVNGKKITEQRLKHADMVIIGKYELRFNSGEPGAVFHAPPRDMPNKGESLPANKIQPSFPIPAPHHSEEVTDAYELWFYALDGEQKGPVDRNMLCRLARDQSIAGSTLVWRAGMPDWIPASDVPGLISTPAAPPVLHMPSAIPAAQPSGPPAVPAPEAKPVPRDEAPHTFPTLPAEEKPVAPTHSVFAFTFAEKQRVEQIGLFALIWGVLLFVYAAYGAIVQVLYGSSLEGVLSVINGVLFGGLSVLVWMTCKELTTKEKVEREAVTEFLNSLWFYFLSHAALGGINLVITVIAAIVRRL